MNYNENNQYQNTEKVLDKKPASRLVAKKEKLAKQIAASVAKRKEEEAKEKKLLANFAAEIDSEAIKIIKKAIADNKYLGDVDQEVKDLLA